MIFSRCRMKANKTRWTQPLTTWSSLNIRQSKARSGSALSSTRLRQRWMSFSRQWVMKTTVSFRCKNLLRMDRSTLKSNLSSNRTPSRIWTTRSTQWTSASTQLTSSRTTLVRSIQWIILSSILTPLRMARSTLLTNPLSIPMLLKTIPADSDQAATSTQLTKTLWNLTLSQSWPHKNKRRRKSRKKLIKNWKWRPRRWSTLS